MKLTPFLLAICTTLLGTTAYSQTGPNQTSYSFGVVPQQAASRLAELWLPVLDYLGEKTGYNIQFSTATDIPTFENRVAAGVYDFAYMNPYHYTVFHQTPGYNALAKQKDQRIVGLLVVRNDSKIADIRELNELTIAFPAPAAFAASVLPMANLKAQGIHFTPQFVASHDSVYQAVAKGLYPAGGGIEGTLANVDPEMRAQLRVLWKTQPFTPHAIAVHPRVPADVVKTIAAAMFAMANDSAGQKSLAMLKFAGFVPAEDSEWDDVRVLKIENLNLQ